MKNIRLIVLFILAIILVFTGFFVFQGREVDGPHRRILSRIRSNGKLIVLTRNAPTTYYEGADGPRGFEFDLVSAFADHLGVKIELKVLDSIAEILREMEKGEGDIAAAGLTRTEEREKRFLFGPSYYTVQQELVCRRNSKIPRTIEDLPNFQMLIISGSSYLERLKELQVRFPSIQWETTDDLSTEQILEKVWKRELDCTVADRNIVAINRRYYPQLIVPFPISGEQPLAWVLKNGGEDLKTEIKNWLGEFQKSGRLELLRNKYYAHVEIFDYFDVAVYHKRIRTRLPLYREWLQQAGKKYRIPWTLLAAQGYQESHWDQEARSPTGVRGIMMLTQRTAESLGVSDRTDPYQSIVGGAKYLARMIKRVPETVAEEDRLRFALAAYNVGFGHLLDARKLADRLGKNPDIWPALKTVLPLLSQKKYYKQLKYGYARGTEPVRYVERIENYRDILEQHMDSIPAL